MSGVAYDYMEEYIRGLIPESTGKLKELEDFAKENGVPIAQKETIKFLEFMVNMKKPLRILELGTAIGYSAIIMQDAAGCNPHITTIERSEEMIKYAKENIKAYGLEDKITIEAGDCLEVLEKLEEPYDLSNVFFIATANYLDNIPAPLRDRLEIVEVSSYTEYEKFEIAKRHLLKKQLLNNGLDEAYFSISDQAIYRIIQEYTREAGVRELERMLGTIIRKAIKNILMNHVERVDIDVDNLEEYLGKPKYTYNANDDLDQVGVVTGLAYTQFGGDTLQVEVTHYKGDGRLVLTGKLGDVMKESAQAALSYVKSNAEKFGIDCDEFKKSDIHIHVPEGAVPKDGPSAGVTIATGIISAFTGQKVDHNVGMTGEITLRGRVLPIGGLREKSIAAHRSGLKTILIPKDNVKDLEEIPASVKNSLNIIPVETVDDVVNHAIIAKFTK